MKGRLFGYLLIGFIALGLSGCIGYAPVQEIDRTITVNEDMSGRLAVEVAYLQSDYELMQNTYADPAATISSQIADLTGWSYYDVESYEDQGYHWIAVTSEFGSVDEFYTQMVGATSDTKTGAGGTGTGQEWDPLYLSKESNFFTTRYTFTWTLIAQAATTDGGEIIPGLLIVKLPGKIVETNGTVLADGETVTWQWGAYDYVPVKLVTQTVNTKAVIGVVAAVSCLCVFFFGVLALVVFFIVQGNRRKAARPA